MNKQITKELKSILSNPNVKQGYLVIAIPIAIPLIKYAINKTYLLANDIMDKNFDFNFKLGSLEFQLKKSEV